jgi:citrate synthase
MKKMDESERKAIKVEFRQQAYAEKVSTRIWQEQASESNPYIGQDVRIHGYNYKDLIMKSSFADTLYLMLTGELPDKPRAKLLERTLCAFANVGPRNNAVRAATTAGVSRAFDTHVLPIGMLVMGGKHQGCGDLAAAIDFLTANISTDTSKTVNDSLDSLDTLAIEANASETVSVLAGFGHYYGSHDPLAVDIADCLLDVEGDWKYLQWAKEFSGALNAANNEWHWLREGIFAAVCCDLNIPKIMAAALYQLCHAPGLIAHGFEHEGSPTTVLPFVSDDDYEIN